MNTFYTPNEREAYKRGVADFRLALLQELIKPRNKATYNHEFIELLSELEFRLQYPEIDKACKEVASNE